MAKMQITLTKSLAGQKRTIQESAKSLGLRKIGQTTVRDDTPIVKGQVRAIRHLVKVEEAN